MLLFGLTKSDIIKYEKCKASTSFKPSLHVIFCMAGVGNESIEVTFIDIYSDLVYCPFL